MEESHFLCRINREDRELSRKQDSNFSKWKILIGPSDWQNHSLGENGIERYRIHNLPINCSRPGSYELGIALEGDARKLDQDSIIPVYIGHADNVRTRLQQYGRSGSHLDHGKSVCYPIDDGKRFCIPKGPGLFKEIFSKGFSIVYRWSPMKSKIEAQKIEGRLLEKFDYAWNKGGNGARRPNDIFRKLDKSTNSSLNTSKKLLQQMWYQFSTCNDWESGDHLLSQIFKFGRSQPRLVSYKQVGNEEYSAICGVTLGDGSICERIPIEGRKRCGEHKGQRMHKSFIKSVIEEKSLVCGVDLEDGSICMEVPEIGRIRCELHKGKRINTSLVIPERNIPKYENITVCGATLGDGSICRNIPNEGRKRCEMHKGERISTSTHIILERKFPNYENITLCGATLADGSACKNRPIEGRKRRGVHKGKRISTSSTTRIILERNFLNYENITHCGATLGDGSTCRNKPIEGRKRCQLHKGERISPTTHIIPERNFLNYENIVVCGAILGNGSTCRNRPTEGRQRCGVHKGERISTTRTEHIIPERNFLNYENITLCGATLGNGSTCRNRPIEGRQRCGVHKGKRIDEYMFSPVRGGTSSVCGASLQNGSSCMRAPVHGRKRCAQHKGMWA